MLLLRRPHRAARRTVRVTPACAVVQSALKAKLASVDVDGQVGDAVVQKLAGAMVRPRALQLRAARGASSRTAAARGAVGLP